MNCNFIHAAGKQIGHGWGRCSRTGVIKCLDCDKLFCTGHIDNKADVCVECIWTSPHNPKNHNLLNVPRIFNNEVRDLNDAIILLTKAQFVCSSGPRTVWLMLDRAIISLDQALREALRENNVV